MRMRAVPFRHRADQDAAVIEAGSVMDMAGILFQTADVFLAGHIAGFAVLMARVLFSWNQCPMTMVIGIIPAKP